MNIISCSKCGVLLDKNKLNFPENIYDKDGNIDLKKAVWGNHHDWVAKVQCPVCSGDVLEDE